MLLGVDVSHFQGRINWAAAKADGVSFAVAKLTQGTGFVDPQGATNVAGMRAAGIVPGGYHFLTPGSAQAQADYFCARVDGAMMHALDVEMPGLDVAGWVQRYRTHFPDKVLLVYTGRDLWTRAGGGNGGAYGPLWAAGFVPNAYLGGGTLAHIAAQIGDHRGGVPFAGWTAPAILQFTDRAQVKGIGGPCDGNAFFGTPDQLTALAGSRKVDDMGELDPGQVLRRLTAYEAAQINRTVPKGSTPAKAGDPLSVLDVATWGGPGAYRTWADVLGVQKQVALLAGQVAALTAAVGALVDGGGITGAEIEAAGKAGAEAALAELGQVLVTPDP